MPRIKQAIPAAYTVPFFRKPAIIASPAKGGSVLFPHHLYVHGSNAVHIVFLEEYEKAAER